MSFPWTTLSGEKGGARNPVYRLSSSPKILKPSPGTCVLFKTTQEITLPGTIPSLGPETRFFASRLNPWTRTGTASRWAGPRRYGYRERSGGGQPYLRRSLPKDYKSFRRPPLGLPASGQTPGRYPSMTSGVSTERTTRSGAQGS